MKCDICKKEIKSLDDLRILPCRASSMVSYVCLQCYTKKISEVLNFKESEKEEMSERHCVNCRHDIRKKDEKGNIYCECEIDGGYISYLQSFEGWCRHWAKDKESEEEK